MVCSTDLFWQVTVTGKGLCNVSTTANHNPDSVLTELTRALVYKGIAVQQKVDTVILHYCG